MIYIVHSYARPISRHKIYNYRMYINGILPLVKNIYKSPQLSDIQIRNENIEFRDHL